MSGIMRPGVQFMLLSTIWFALMNVCVKRIVHIPASEIILFRAGITLLFTSVQIMQLRISPWGQNKPVLILRGLFGTIALTAYFMTLKKMPLATAISIQYLSPVFTVIISRIMLGERFFWLQWLFFGVSFSGVLLLRWSEEEMSWLWASLGVGSALFSGLAYNMIRKAASTEHPSVVVFYFPLVAFPLVLPWAISEWVNPVGMDWMYLILAGVFTQFAQMAMTRAYMAERAAAISALQYLGLVYGLGFGILLFGESYGWVSIVGMMLIVGGVVSNLFAYDWWKKRQEK